MTKPLQMTEYYTTKSFDDGGVPFLLYHRIVTHEDGTQHYTMVSPQKWAKECEVPNNQKMTMPTHARHCTAAIFNEKLKQTQCDTPTY